MIFPSYDLFCKKAGEGNLIPVYREMIADTETPVSAFLKIRGSAYAYLLESVEGGEKWGRNSFLGTDPLLVIRGYGHSVEVIKNGTTSVIPSKNPLNVLRGILSEFKPVPLDGLPRFFGGAVGTMGYGAARFFEQVESKRSDPAALQFIFLLAETLLVFDNVAHRIKIISNTLIQDSNLKPDSDLQETYLKAVEKINQVVHRLEQPDTSGFSQMCDEWEAAPTRGAAPTTGAAPARGAALARGATLAKGAAPATPSAKRAPPQSNVSREAFKEKVRIAQDYIKAGDIFQVQLSQRFSTTLTCDPFLVYRALRSINPSPYMYYLQFESLRLVGTSPEVLVRLEEREVTMRPIAGTRRRGESPEEDLKMASDLLSDPKELAEHIMLVDLGRNDLGRVCEYGTVKVNALMVIERYSHVMHIVSNLVGRLQNGKDAFDLLKAAFPAGTVTGSPKIRAMQIIEELEPSDRGFYAGMVGYFSFQGNLDTCITIRTIIIDGDCATIQAAAGIVADSDPDLEYEETVNKARAMLMAIELAERWTRR